MSAAKIHFPGKPLKGDRRPGAKDKSKHHDKGKHSGRDWFGSRAGREVLR